MVSQPNTTAMVILADDVTGACDTGVKLVSQGLRVDVCIHSEALPRQNICTEVLSISTNTRNLPTDQARTLTADICRSLQGQPLIYKKVDSLLRGNVGAELEVMLDILDYDGAILAPSLPEQGRTVEQGRILANMADGTTTCIDGLACVRRTTDLPCGSLSLEAIRNGHDRLRSQIRDQFAAGVRILLADAQTQEDLDALASCLADGEKLLFAGSAGLVERVWTHSGIRLEAPAVQEAAGPCRHLLAVVGSISATTVQQLQKLKGRTDVCICVLDTAGPQQTWDREGCLQELTASDAPVRVLVTRDAYEGRSINIQENTANKNISAYLAQIAEDVAAQSPVDGLLLTGGDTAQAYFERTGVELLHLEGEILPGLVLLGLRQPDGKRLRAVTKSGSFGTEDTLVSLMKKMTMQHQ